MSEERSEIAANTNSQAPYELWTPTLGGGGYYVPYRDKESLIKAALAICFGNNVQPKDQEKYLGTASGFSIMVYKDSADFWLSNTDLAIRHLKKGNVGGKPILKINDNRGDSNSVLLREYENQLKAIRDEIEYYHKINLSAIGPLGLLKQALNATQEQAPPSIGYYVSPEYYNSKTYPREELFEDISKSGGYTNLDSLVRLWAEGYKETVTQREKNTTSHSFPDLPSWDPPVLYMLHELLPQETANLEDEFPLVIDIPLVLTEISGIAKATEIKVAEGLYILQTGISKEAFEYHRKLISDNYKYFDVIREKYNELLSVLWIPFYQDIAQMQKVNEYYSSSSLVESNVRNQMRSMLDKERNKAWKFLDEKRSEEWSLPVEDSKLILYVQAARQSQEYGIESFLRSAESNRIVKDAYEKIVGMDLDNSEWAKMILLLQDATVAAKARHKSYWVPVENPEATSIGDITGPMDENSWSELDVKSIPVAPGWFIESLPEEYRSGLKEMYFDVPKYIPQYEQEEYERKKRNKMSPGRPEPVSYGSDGASQELYARLSLGTTSADLGSFQDMGSIQSFGGEGAALSFAGSSFTPSPFNSQPSAVSSRGGGGIARTTSFGLQITSMPPIAADNGASFARRPLNTITPTGLKSAANTSMPKTEPGSFAMGIPRMNIPLSGSAGTKNAGISRLPDGNGRQVIINNFGGTEKVSVTEDELVAILKQAATSA